MSLILARDSVLEIYESAAARKWTIPTFCTENLTTTEAILSGTLEFGRKKGIDNLPVTIAITNQYAHRSQSAYYTHTRKWDLGLKLFLADIDVLTAQGSPFEKLDVMIHLDHTQWDTDTELLKWDMGKFSMIMFDASGLPFGENIRRTAEFVRNHGSTIVIEGACDEILDAGGAEKNHLTTPEDAVRYLDETGVDFIVANLGTEHRASGADLKYHSSLAQRISRLTGPKLVLHGTSSVTRDQIRNLYHDGIAKVNIWTGLERDSSPFLLEDMILNASKILGKEKTLELMRKGLLGDKVKGDSRPQLSHFTTVYRQDIIFSRMKEIVYGYLETWYT